MEYYLLNIVNIIVFLIMVFILNIVIEFAQSLVVPHLSIMSTRGYRSTKFNFNFLSHLIKLLSKDNSNFHFSDLLWALLLLIFSLGPLFFIPIDIGFSENNYLQLVDTSYGALYSFGFILIYQSIVLVLGPFSTHNSIGKFGIKYARELVSLAIIYSLVLSVIFQISESFDFKVINSRLSFKDFLEFLPLIFVFTSFIIGTFKKQRKMDNIVKIKEDNKTISNFLLAILILTERLFLISYITVFISLFFQEQIYFGSNVYILFSLGFIAILCKVFFVTLISKTIEGFKLIKLTSPLFDFDLDFKILLLLTNFILLVLI